MHVMAVKRNMRPYYFEMYGDVDHSRHRIAKTVGIISLLFIVFVAWIW